MRITTWVAIPDYVGYYEISNFGEVRSIDRKIALQDGTRLVKGKPIKLKNNGSNYLFATLCREGKRANKYVHRLLAICFIPMEEAKPFVNHIDGNPQNNNLENLEWVSHSENVKHAYEIGLNTNQKGQHFKATGVIDNQLGKKYSSIKEWCTDRGINYSTGRNALLGKAQSTVDISLVEKVPNGENRA